MKKLVVRVSLEVMVPDDVEVDGNVADAVAGAAADRLADEIGLDDSAAIVTSFEAA